jgi:hypothetical protein
MRFALSALLLLHALINLLGFGKAFGWPVPIQQAISKPKGLAWLAASVLLMIGAVLLATQPRSLWWMAALPAVVLSQTLIVFSWNDAKFGTILNIAILLPLTVTLLEYRNSSYVRRYQQEIARRLDAPPSNVIVTDNDIAHLPNAVRRYVEITGAVGRPRVENFHVTMRGEIRRSTDAAWMPFEADQHSFFGDNARLFLLRASQLGVPFAAYHRYAESAATMQVRVASLFTIVDARGPEMNQSETVTMFNDMCLLAPATLIDPTIRWKEIDPLTVVATFTNASNTVSALLSFNDAGELVNFHSDDRYLSADGKTYSKYRWSTPMRNYREFDGRRIASHGEASWRLPPSEFVYARIEILSIEYNVRAR